MIKDPLAERKAEDTVAPSVPAGSSDLREDAADVEIDIERINDDEEGESAESAEAASVQF